MILRFYVKKQQIIIILDKDIKEILKDLENKMFLRVKLQLVLVASLCRNEQSINHLIIKQ